MSRNSRWGKKSSFEFLEGRRLLTRLPDFLPIAVSESLAYETRQSAVISPDHETVTFETSLDGGHQVAARVISESPLSIRVLAPNQEMIASGTNHVQFQTDLTGDYTLEISADAATNASFEFEAMIDAIFEDTENDLAPDSEFSLDDKFRSLGADTDYLVVRGNYESPRTVVLEEDFSNGRLPDDWEVEDWHYSGNIRVSQDVHPPTTNYSLLSEGMDDVTVNAVSFRVEIPSGWIPTLSFDHLAMNDEPDRFSFRQSYGDGVQYSFDEVSWRNFGNLRDSPDGQWTEFSRTFSRSVTSEDGSDVPIQFRIMHVANGQDSYRAFSNVRIDATRYARDRYSLTLEPGEPFSVAVSDWRTEMSILDADGNIVVEGYATVHDFRNLSDRPANYYLQFDHIDSPYDFVAIKNGVLRTFGPGQTQKTTLQHRRVVADNQADFFAVADESGKILLDVQTPFQDFAADNPSLVPVPTVFSVSQGKLTTEPIERGVRHVITVPPHEKVLISLTSDGRQWRGPSLLSASGIKTVLEPTGISRWDTSEFPERVTVEFGRAVVSETINADQLAIGNQSAIAVDASPTSATFIFPPDLNFPNGNYSINFFADQSIGVAGESLRAATTIFEFDPFGPQISSMVPAFGEVVEPTTEIRIQFDESVSGNPESIYLSSELRSFERRDLHSNIGDGIEIDALYLPEDNYTLAIPQGALFGFEPNFPLVDEINLTFSTDHSSVRTLRLDHSDPFDISHFSPTMHGAIHSRRDEDAFKIVGQPSEQVWLALDVLNSNTSPSLMRADGVSLAPQTISERTSLYGPLTLDQSGELEVSLGGSAAFAYELAATTHPVGERYSANDAVVVAVQPPRQVAGTSIYQTSGQSTPGFANGDALFATRQSGDGSAAAVQLDPETGAEIARFALPEGTEVAASIDSRLLLRNLRSISDETFSSLLLVDPVTHQQVGSFSERRRYDFLAETPDAIEAIGGLPAGAYDADNNEIAGINQSAVIQTNPEGELLSFFQVSPSSRISSVGMSGDSYFVNEDFQVSVFSSDGEYLRTWQADTDLGFTFARSSLRTIPDEDRFQFDLSEHVGQTATFLIQAVQDKPSFEGIVDVLDSRGNLVATFDSPSGVQPIWSIVDDANYVLRVRGTTSTEYSLTLIVNAEIAGEATTSINGKNIVVAGKSAVAFRGFAAIGQDVIEFDPRTGARLNTIATAPRQITDVTYDGESVYYTHGGTITRLNLESGEETSQGLDATASIDTYGDLLLGSTSRDIELYDFESQQVLDEVNRLSDGRASLAVAGDRNEIYVVSGDRIYPLATGGDPVALPLRLPFPIDSIDYADNQLHVASAGVVHVFDLDRGRVVRRYVIESAGFERVQIAVSSSTDTGYFRKLDPRAAQFDSNSYYPGDNVRVFARVGSNAESISSTIVSSSGDATVAILNRNDDGVYEGAIRVRSAFDPRAGLTVEPGGIISASFTYRANDGSTRLASATAQVLSDPSAHTEDFGFAAEQDFQVAISAFRHGDFFEVSVYDDTDFKVASDVLFEGDSIEVPHDGPRSEYRIQVSTAARSFVASIQTANVDIQELIGQEPCRITQLQDPRFDLDRNGIVDVRDVLVYVRDVLGASVGDSNFDGLFNSTDLVAAFQASEYEDAIAGNSTWSEGDWNCDGDFSSTDFVFAFTNGRYSRAVGGLSVSRVLGAALFTRQIGMGRTDQEIAAVGESDGLSFVGNRNRPKVMFDQLPATAAFLPQPIAKDGELRPDACEKTDCIEEDEQI